jgi:hypothetical protein
VIAIISNILDSFFEAIREMLIDLIISNLTGIFESFNDQINETAERVSTSPTEWLAASPGTTPWEMIRNVAFTATSTIMVIAGLILGFFIALELVQMLVEKNNLADLDMVGVVIKWIVKSFIAIMIVANTGVIIGAIFQLGQEAITGAAADMVAEIDLTSDDFIEQLEAQFEELSLGRLVGLLLQIQILRIIAPILGIAIMIITVGRMLEIMMYLVVAPIPLATMANSEYRSMGNNYLKSLVAVAFQGLLILAVVAIMGTLIQNWIIGVGSPDAEVGLWTVFGYMVLSIFALVKTSSISKSIFGAH